jgi:hypothetical protein
VGEPVFFKVKSKRILLKLGSFVKLAVRHYEPFEILERISLVSYMLALPISMRIQNMFHVFLLKKYVPDPSHVIDWKGI